MKLFCCGDKAESYTAQKVVGEIAFCQLTSISECDSTIQERLIDIQSDDEAPVLFHTHGWSNFWIKCSERFPELRGKVKLLLLWFPTTYFPEQGFCQVGYCTRVTNAAIALT